MVAPESKASATGPIRGARGFYVRALSAAERAGLEEALQVDGIDEEIALLRLRLQQAVADEPKDFELMFRGTALIARLVQTRFGLSKGETSNIEAAVERAVASLKELAGEGNDE